MQRVILAILISNDFNSLRCVNIFLINRANVRDYREYVLGIILIRRNFRNCLNCSARRIVVQDEIGSWWWIITCFQVFSNRWLLCFMYYIIIHYVIHNLIYVNIHFLYKYKLLYTLYMNKLITMYYIIEQCYILLYYINFVRPSRSFELLCDVLCSFERNSGASKFPKKNHFVASNFAVT